MKNCTVLMYYSFLKVVERNGQGNCSAKIVEETQQMVGVLWIFTREWDQLAVLHLKFWLYRTSDTKSLPPVSQYWSKIEKIQEQQNEGTIFRRICALGAAHTLMFVPLLVLTALLQLHTQLCPTSSTPAVPILPVPLSSSLAVSQSI